MASSERLCVVTGAFGYTGRYIAETLASALADSRSSVRSLEALASHLPMLLIYGLDRCSPDCLKRLFGTESIAAIAPPTSQHSKHRYSLPPSGSAISRQFAGLSFEAFEGRGSVRLSGRDAGSAVRIIDCDGMPFFVSIRRRGCEVFLLASSRSLDLNQRTQSNVLPNKAYPKLLPWLFFIHRALGDGLRKGNYSAVVQKNGRA